MYESEWTLDHATWHYQAERISAEVYRCGDCGNRYRLDGQLMTNATVTFQYEDGTMIWQGVYELGAEVQPPADPYKAPDNTYTYTFVGWDKEIVACAGDTIYTAQFVRYVPGDMDGNMVVDDEDAIYLLLNTMFGNAYYPLSYAPSDIDCNGIVNSEDAVYLLLHTLFGEALYPLEGGEADVDSNGRVDQDDAIYLLLHTLFGDAFYPIEQ